MAGTRQYEQEPGRCSRKQQITAAIKQYCSFRNQAEAVEPGSRNRNQALKKELGSCSKNQAIVGASSSLLYSNYRADA